jgi:type II secretion system protein H
MTSVPARQGQEEMMESRIQMVSNRQSAIGNLQGKAKGITLLELLVVMTLIAILSALVYPSFGNALSNLRLNGESRRLISACRLAKWEAISKHQPFRVVVDIQQNRIFVADVATKTLKELELPPGIRIDRAQKTSPDGVMDTTEFYFFPNGTAEAGVIVLRDDREHKVKIGIDMLTGDAKVQES